MRATKQEEPPVLIPEKKILRRVEDLARQVSVEYRDVEELLLVGVLKGCFIFLADLSRLLTIPRRVDFITLADYGPDADPFCAARPITGLRTDISGKHVLIVEDIADTGNTLEVLGNTLLAMKPASMKTCVLLRKKECMKKEVRIDYLGFDIPDLWVVGYGLDYEERHRALPYIGFVKTD